MAITFLLCDEIEAPKIGRQLSALPLIYKNRNTPNNIFYAQTDVGAWAKCGMPTQSIPYFQFLLLCLFSVITSLDETTKPHNPILKI